jgi:hypothetical protein
MAKFISWLLSPKTISILIAVVILYAISPFLITFAGAGLAGLFGCNGGRVENNCPSPEMAEFFTTLTVVHWLAMVTLPTGLLVAGVLAIILVLRLIMLQRRS